MDVMEIVFVALVAVCSVATAVWHLSRRPVMPAPPPADTSSVMSVLLYKTTVADVTPEFAAVLNIGPGDVDWSDLRVPLEHRFDGLPTTIDDMPTGTISYDARDGRDLGRLVITRKAETTQIEIEERIGGDTQTLQLEAELKTLHRIADSSPFPSWQSEANGRVSWYNPAYEALCAEAGIDAAASLPLFSDNEPLTVETRKRRVSVRSKAGNETFWYDLTQRRIGMVTINHAVDIEPVIQAEIAQRNFVQTLTKTFAQLSIGLAIFDRNGQLALFNPALVDLTKLPADFLSGRPNLASFFDRLREARTMPEPKSYVSWRQQIASVIAAATDGSYQETWTLESGQTYRVSGRPHPDRAIAFLIEDISAEILMTRNYRAEVELGQSLMDSLSEPIVVFSGSGILTFCNAAYRSLFGVDPQNSFADVTIIDALRDWQRVSEPNPAFGDIRDFVQDPGERSTWECRMVTKDGAHWTVQVQPIAAGSTALRMVPAPALVEAAQ